MKRNLLLIGIVLATLLIGSVIAETGTEIAEQDVSATTVFWNNLIHSLNLQAFSVVGDDRVCGTSGGNPNYAWSVGSGQNFLTGTVLSGSRPSSITNNPSNSIIDIFTNGWTPFVETKNFLTYGGCGTSSGPCNIEIYTCPAAEPTSQSNCASGTIFTSVSCPSWSGTSFYKCPTETRIPYYYNSYKYCEVSTTKPCWYKTGSSCNPRTYDSNLFPNSCESYTYNSLPLYSTESACLGSTCVPLWQTGSWSTCANNVQTRTVTDSNNCGTASGKPSTSQSCSSGNGCPSGQTLCSDGVCRTTCETPTGNADFKVTVLSASPSVFTSETPVDILVKIKNNGGTGSMKVEVGLYKDSDIADWGFVVVADATNCEPNEQNVDTKLITLNAGEETTQTFTIITPKICRDILDPIGEFDLLALSFLNCKNTGLAVGVTSSSRLNVMFNPRIDCTGSCTNGIRDGEETDTDCGGSVCNKCRSGWRCEKATDCQSGLACLSGYCSPSDSSRGNQKGLNPSKIAEMTAEDLAASACTQTIQCENKSSCKSLKYLTDEGILTDEEANQILDKSTIFFGSAGAIGGIGGCIAGAAALAIPTAGATAILFPLCGLAGGALGLGINEIWDKFTTKDKSIAGYCILEKGGLDSYFKWAAWFDITGDGVKDGTDGMIIVLIGGAILLVLFMRR